MINKLIKKIGFICLGLASLALAGCFHIPDEDWIPSKNKVDTGDIQKDDEVNEAIDSFIDGINIISSQWDEMKNNESNGISTDDGSENTIDTEDNTINNEETLDNTETTYDEVKNEEVEEDIAPEE